MTTNIPTILAVASGVETSAEVLEAALDRVEQESASLVVLHVMPDRVFENRQRSMARSRDLTYDGFTFTHSQAVEVAESVARRAAKAVIGDRDIPFVAVGRVGGLVSTVLAVAAAYDCQTIFLPKTTSWAHRVVGRANHRISNRFDGTVVQVSGPPPENLQTLQTKSEE